VVKIKKKKEEWFFSNKRKKKKKKKRKKVEQAQGERKGLHTTSAQWGKKEGDGSNVRRSEKEQGRKGATLHVSRA
jgi:hypothetical protein